MEITNNGKTEINIGDWKITGMQKDFIFPQDTIIGAGNDITLSKEDLGIDASSSRISLKDPAGGELSFTNANNLGQQAGISNQTENNSGNVSANDSISVADAEKLLKKYNDSLALKNSQTNETENLAKASTSTTYDGSENINQTATVLDSVNSPPSKGFWSKLIDIPVNGIKSFVHIFYNF